MLAAASLSLAAPGAGAEQATTGKVLVLKTTHIKQLGTVLTTSAGMTLYLFAHDTSGAATCTGACAKFWPPLTLPKGDSHVRAPHGVKGISVIRVNGHPQVFFRGHALYRFIEDKKGQAKGQNVEGTWFAALANGKSSAPNVSAAPNAGTSTNPTTAPPSRSNPTKSTSTTAMPTTTTTHATTGTGSTPPSTQPPTTTTQPPTITTQPPTTTTTAPPTGGAGF
jgi:predicted lipoprotein with Yx(FWY)xxD motif